MFVCCASPSDRLYVFLPASGSVHPSVFESIKYLRPIYHLLPVSFPPHPFLHLVVFPVFLRPVLLHRAISVSLSVCTLFHRSGLTISQRQRQPCSVNLSFYSFFLRLFPFLPYFLRYPSPFYVFVSWDCCYQKR